jgi:hypothetical protein
MNFRLSENLKLIQAKPEKYMIKERGRSESASWMTTIHKTFASESNIWKFANNFYRKVG